MLQQSDQGLVHEKRMSQTSPITALLERKRDTIHETVQTSYKSRDASRRGDTEIVAEMLSNKERNDEDGYVDLRIVDWDGRSDPRRPVNWSFRKKLSNLSVVAFLTFITPLASSMVAPAVPLVMNEFGSDNATIASFIVSIYLLGYALGPCLVAPMSEVYGRLVVYHTCNILFLVWNVGCALSPSLSALLAFRLIAGTAGSCPLTLGGGSIADICIQEERGRAMAFFAIGPMIGPVVGPLIGGYLGEGAGWRWVFWLLTLLSGVCAILSAFIQHESYEPVLLQRVTAQLRKDTGNIHLRSKLDRGISKKENFGHAIVRPMKMLLFSPIVASLSIHVATVYAYLYLLFTSLTEVFETQYGFSQGSVGLTFLGIGIGSLTEMFIFGALSDPILKRMSTKAGGEMKPEFRLPLLIPGGFFIPIGFFWFGWSVQAKLHWMMPITGTFFIGFGMLATLMPIQTYLVDTFTYNAASAIAANTILRSLAGAFLPLAGPKLYASLGWGWGNSACFARTSLHTT